MIFPLNRTLLKRVTTLFYKFALTINTLKVQKFISKKSLPHMLFYGSPGTGKTSAILAIANQMYGKNATNGMVMELNASDDRGISVVREKIIIFSKSKGLFWYK